MPRWLEGPGELTPLAPRGRGGNGIPGSQMNGINTDRRALVVSSVSPAEATAQRIGREAYSYRFVYRAFAPLLAKWGRITEVTNAESRLDHTLWQSRRQNVEPLHLSFLPLHLVYLTQKAKN